MFGALIPPWGYAAIGGGILLLGFSGGYTVRDWQCDAATAKVAEKAIEREREVAKAYNDQAVKYEQELASDASKNAAGSGKIREIYRTVQVPAACAADPTAVGVLGEIVTRANAAATGEPVDLLSQTERPAATANRP